jgi:hypothetical protein
MTFITGRFFIEPVIKVAGAALELFVDITKDHADNLSMVEILGRPVSVARRAARIKSGDSLPLWMT